jgi:2-polyprenyl-6-methoxyphenol hydroxylase-like FAD-dependent oxidoreductase
MQFKPRQLERLLASVGQGTADRQAVAADDLRFRILARGHAPLNIPHPPDLLFERGLRMVVRRSDQLGGFLQIVELAELVRDLWQDLLPRRANDTFSTLGTRIGNGLFLIFIDRFDYWQIGCVIPKGAYQEFRAAGLEHLRQALVRAAPELADRVEVLSAWKQVAVLSVESSRLRRWYKPGLLLIGDAAHVMSPVGGLGINYAIADAVEASNILGPKLAAGMPIGERELVAVQRRRMLPTTVVQRFQTLAQGAVRAQVASTSAGRAFEPPRVIRRLLKSPWMLMIPAWFIGFGLRPAHVQPSEASSP